MRDEGRTREQLIAENDDLRRRVAALEKLAEENQSAATLPQAAQVLDITARKKVEQALAESEAKYRYLVETTGTGYLILDEEGRVVDANAEYVRISGHHCLTEILGRNVVDWTAPYDVERNAGEIRKCLEEGTVWELEVDYIGPGGKTTPVEINASVIETEQGKRILSLCRDITERKRAAEALRESEERFRVVFEEAPVGLVIAVGNGVIVRANRALRRMSGYSQEELVGRHVREFTYPEDRQLSDPFVKMFLAGEIFSFTLEKRYLRKDGQHFWAQATTAATHGPDGRFAFALGIVEDITERKQAEEALKRERHTLKRMLEASDHERRLISYDIHDGLAQELAGAIMYFQIYARAREAEAKDAAKAFDTGVMMLQQSYVEARRLISGVRPPILDESGVVAAIAHMVYDPAFDRGPKIDLRNRVAFQRLDPILENVIYRIVQEGLTNARNHSRSEKIRVSLVQRAKRLWIEIRDWGLGFDPQTVRANRFGLEGICERARLLGGNCRIHSKPGKGTSVIVELPVVERERKQEP